MAQRAKNSALESPTGQDSGRRTPSPRLTASLSSSGKKNQPLLTPPTPPLDEDIGFPLTKSLSRDVKRRAAIFSGLLLANEDSWASLLAIISVEMAPEVAPLLVRIFAAEGSDFKLVKYCVMKDVTETHEEALLLRGSGIHCAVVAYAGLYHGRAYLQNVIAPVLHQFLHKSSVTFEIDPRRAGSEDIARKNADHLVTAANHVLAALLQSVDEMPIALRRTFEFAQRCVAGKFPSHGIRLITNLFFLRLLCPALVAPEEYGLCKSRPSDSVMRAHVLLAKLLQSVANEVPPFGKEEYMRPLNHWVEAAIPSVRRFFKIALNLVSGDSLESSQKLNKLHALANPDEEADNKALFRFVRANYGAYRAHLAQSKAIEALRILIEICPEEEEANRLPRAASTECSDESPRTPDAQVLISP